MPLALTNFQMVKNRLPFIKDPGDAGVVEDFRLEIVYYLQGILGKTDLQVEDEAAYSGIEKGLIADIDAVYLILRKGMMNSQGDSSSNADPVPVVPKTVKKAKADVTEVEYEVLKPENGVGLYASLEKYLNMYKAAAAQKARQLGFILNICEDCTLAIESLTPPLGFIVVPDSDCGCNG